MLSCSAFKICFLARLSRHAFWTGFQVWPGFQDMPSSPAFKTCFLARLSRHAFWPSFQVMLSSTAFKTCFPVRRVDGVCVVVADRVCAALKLDA